MKKLLYSILALSALLSVSCTREMPDLNDNLAGSGIVKFHAYAEPLTKTAYENEKVFSWVEGDKVSLLVQNEENGLIDVAEFTALSSGAETDFAGIVPDGYRIADYALYPRGTGNDYYSSDLGLVIGDEDQLLLRTWGTITPDIENPMSSIPLIGKKDAQGNFTFHTATGILKVTVADVPEDAYMITLDLPDNNTAALNGNFSFGDDLTIKMENVVGTKWGQKYASFKAPEGGGTMSFYFPIPVGTIPAGLKVKVASQSQGDLLIATTVNPIQIERNRITVTPELDIPESGWISIGTGKYMDDHGYYYLGRGGRTAADYQDVEIERNIAESNRYRIRNPYAIEEAGDLMDNADEYLYLKVKSDGVVDNEPYYWAPDQLMFDPAWYHMDQDAMYFNNRVLGYLADGFTPSNIQLAPVYMNCSKDETIWLWGANCAQNPKIEIVFPGAEPMWAGHFNYPQGGTVYAYDEESFAVSVNEAYVSSMDLVLAHSLNDGYSALVYNSGTISHYNASGMYYLNNPAEGTYNIVYKVNTSDGLYVYKHTGDFHYPKYNTIALTADMITPIATSEYEGSIANLVDGDTSTYWHSPYGSEPEPWNDPTYGVYIDINLSDAGVSLLDFDVQFCLRDCMNDHPDIVYIYASEDGENWGEPLGGMSGIFESVGAGNWTPRISCAAAQASSFIRIAILQANGETKGAVDLTQGGCTHMAELVIYQKL